MEKELEDKLFTKYPKLFRQKDLSCRETCMCWGVETGDGWYDLINHLCRMLQFNIDRNGDPQIEVVQCKEKYGQMCFYTNGSNDRQHGFISFAEYLSMYICETCGSNNNVKQTKGWITSLCEKCMEKQNEL